MWKPKTREWERSICNREWLSCDEDVVTNELIKDKCNCVHKNVCFELVRLMKSNKYEEAEEFLDKYKKLNGV